MQTIPAMRQSSSPPAIVSWISRTNQRMDHVDELSQDKQRMYRILVNALEEMNRGPRPKYKTTQERNDAAKLEILQCLGSLYIDMDPAKWAAWQTEMDDATNTDQEIAFRFVQSTARGAGFVIRACTFFPHSNLACTYTSNFD